MRILIGSLLVVCSVVFAVPAGAAVGGAPTREEYVKRADSICKPVVKRGNRLFERGDRQLEQGHETRGANLFIDAWRSFKPVIAKLRGLPRPDGDAQKIGRYLDLERKNADMLVKAWKLFKREKYDPAIKLGRRAGKVHDRAHKAVRGFGFRYCA